jgi:hypothetical protein
MKRHPFDPISFVLGLTFGGLGLFFLIGERTAADIGWKWMWPFPFIVLGLLFVVSAARRLLPAPETDDGSREDEASADDD